MSEDGIRQERRAMAQIEGDLLKAEEAFADADTRLKAAERERRTALEAINRHQMEFDEAVAQLRQRSIPGSRWRRDMGEAKDLLILQPEDVAEGENSSNSLNLMSQAAEDLLAEDFRRLRASVNSEGSDAVLKVVGAYERS